MRLLITALLLLPQILFSQITVTAADFANAGDTVRMSKTTDPAIDFATTGPNSNWDFSTLTAQSQSLIEFYDMSNVSTFVNFIFGGFAPPKYQGSYYLPSTDIPLAQMSSFLPVSIDNVYQFTRKTADSITSIGFALSIDSNEVPFKSDTIETRYAFPLNYGNTHSSMGYTNLDMNPIFDAIWRQHRQRYTEVDGWGSVITPYGTFDAIRIKHSITEIDSLRINFGGSPFWINLPIPDSYIYEWWTNGEDEAVMRIETSLIAGNEVVNNIEYRDNYLGLDASLEETSQLNVSVYPNPVTENLTIGSINGSFTSTIIDLNGQVVSTCVDQSILDLSELETGEYILWINSTEGNKIHRFTKK